MEEYNLCLEEYRPYQLAGWRCCNVKWCSSCNARVWNDCPGGCQMTHSGDTRIVPERTLLVRDLKGNYCVPYVMAEWSAEEQRLLADGNEISRLSDDSSYQVLAHTSIIWFCYIL